jgi:hypothetical protein
MFQLGTYFHRGERVPHDPDEAMRWCRTPQR